MTWDEAQAFLRKWEKKITDDLKVDAAELKVRCTGERLILFEKKLELYQSTLMPYITSSQRFETWRYLKIITFEPSVMESNYLS